MKTSVAASGCPPDSLSTAANGEKNINPELWQSCAGPLVNLPAVGTHVIYFPQGHSEQVASSMKKDMDAQIPNYPNLPSKLLCLLQSVTLHADPETDEVYAQMTLQPVSSFDREALLRSDFSTKASKPQLDFFCKTLTASDTSTHGGFSVPRRAAEKIFPPLDFTMDPPTQELVARDLHDVVWKFRHIYRGKPKRHLLTSGWSLFVSGKRLFAGDSVLFIRDEKQQLLLGTRRANRQPTNLSSSVLSSDSMHIGILAAAAHAASNNSPFTVFYNPRASPSEFVIPLAKYYKSVSCNQISLGMRFRMMFETEESGTRRYMGTITGISDLDPIRWKNSQWRNLQVGWDESNTGERRNRVSVWEIEPVTAPFFICPTQPFFHSKRPRQTGMPDEDSSSDLDSLFRRTVPWLGDEFGLKDPQAMPGLSLAQWMNMKQQSSVAQPISSSALNPLGSIIQSQPQLPEVIQPQRLSQSLPTNQVHPQILQQQTPMQAHNVLQQQQSLINYQIQRNLSQTLPQQQQQQILSHNLPQNLMSLQQNDHVNQQLLMSENHIQFQLLQKLNQQQSVLQQPSQLEPQKPLLDIPPNFPRSMSTNQTMDASEAMPIMLSQSLATQHMSSNNCQNNLRFPVRSPSQPKLHHQLPGILSEVYGNPTNNQLSTGCSSLMTAAGGGQSVVTDDLPSCSTSPSTNNFANAAPSIMNSRNRLKMIGEDIAQSSSTILNSTSLEALPPDGSLIKNFPPKSEVKPSVILSKNQNQVFYPSQAFMNAARTQVDYLDSSSSATSVLTHNDALLHQNNSTCFNSQSMLFRDSNHDGEVQDDLRTNASFGGDNLDNQLAIPTMNDAFRNSNISSGGGILSTYENPKESQNELELSTSMVSQSFGVPDIAFNSIDSTINDDSFMNRGAWAPPPQIPRMRTYTKVYKRGAVGRSIDIMRYSGYDDLKQDLARRFGIEGQLENHQRIGWNLVYVDHENDVLLVGDDPWEEFVNCVRCIKILSHQEVQQMSLDRNFSNNLLQNQDCSSSENGLN